MSPIAPRGGCAYSRLGAIQAVSAVQRTKLQELYGSPVMHGQSVLKYHPLLHPGRICRGTAIDGYVNLLHAAGVLKIWKQPPRRFPSPYNP